MATIEHAQDNPQLLSVRRTATRLGIGRGTAYRLIKNGEIPAVRVGGSIRVDPDVLDAWLAEQRTGRSDS